MPQDKDEVTEEVIGTKIDEENTIKDNEIAINFQ